MIAGTYGMLTTFQVLSEELSVIEQLNCPNNPMSQELLPHFTEEERLSDLPSLHSH